MSGAGFAACDGCVVSAVTCFLAVESESVETVFCCGYLHLRRQTCGELLLLALGVTSTGYVALSLCCLLEERGPTRFCPLLLCVCVCLCLRQLWRRERVDVGGFHLAAVVKGLLWRLGRLECRGRPGGLAGVGAVGSCGKEGLAVVVALVKSAVVLERCQLLKGESEK